jgi:hypothetical protein
MLLSLVGAVSDEFAARAGERVLVHGSAMVVDGRAALCVGAERAGKSWLAFAAWRAGLTVIGDDMIALHPGEGTAAAFPRPLKLRVTELCFASELTERGSGGQMVLGRVDGELRLAIGRRLPGMAHLAAHYPVSHLFFLSRLEAGPSTVVALADPRQAVALLTAATAIGGSPPDLRVVSLLKGLWDGGRVARLGLGPDDAGGALTLLAGRLVTPR